MPLEKANTIAELDSIYPLPSDLSSRGDDHLRLLKSVMKKQFPGKDGNGFNVPITLTEEFLNGLPKAIQDLQKSIDGRWPVGSLLFLVSGDDPQKTGFPGVWTKLAEDASLHINSTDQAAGVYSGENLIEVPLVKHGHTATFKGELLAPHSHDGVPGRSYSEVGGRTGATYNVYENGSTSTASAGTPKGSVTIAETGTATPKMDVRGKRYLINVWRRVS